MTESNYLNGFRTYSFWMVSIVLMLILGITDWLDWFDTAILSYAMTGVISVLCAILFADWWRQKGSASSIYKWITILLFSIAFNDALQVVTRWTYVYHHSDYEGWIQSSLWQYRSLPKLLALIYLLSFAIWQRWGKASTLHNGIRNDMANGFEKIHSLIQAGDLRVDTLEARIIDGELRFESHIKESGLIVAAKFILKPKGEKT
jgi:hypothetical protein